MAKNDHFWPFWAVFLVAFDHPTWNWVNQAWISIPLDNAHILRPNLIGATGFATFMKLYQPMILWRDVAGHWTQYSFSFSGHNILLIGIRVEMSDEPLGEMFLNFIDRELGVWNMIFQHCVFATLSSIKLDLSIWKVL